MYKDILEMIDRETAPEVMTKAEALEFLELLGNAVEVRMEGIKVDMANAGDLAKLPKLRAKSATRARAHEQVKTRFKIPKAKK